MQTTTIRDLEVRGRGIHTGSSSVLRVHRREEDGAGLRFYWPGSPSPLLPEDMGALSRRVSRSTRLDSGNISIRTPEHLLAAALLFADAPLDVHCDAEEPPGLDGSAIPFFEAMARAVPEAAERPAWREYSSRLVWRHAGPEGVLSAEPAPSFSVEYELDRPPLRQRFVLSDPAAAVPEILPARTFIFLREWEAAQRDPELLRGGGMESGLLYAETPEEFAAARAAHPEFQGNIFPLLHPESERRDQEAVKHKILDLLGDLALLDLALPRLRLRIRNGGHALNHLLLERLQHE